jgi:Tfp pilus assembly protein FimT
VLRFQQWIAERRQEHFADELVHQLAAAAMRQQHVRVLRDGNGTDRREGFAWFHDSPVIYDLRFTIHAPVQNSRMIRKS